MVQTRINLAEAWTRRAQKAQADLNAAAAAPGLFTPAFISQRFQMFRHAIWWAQFWQGQVVAR